MKVVLSPGSPCWSWWFWRNEANTRSVRHLPSWFLRGNLAQLYKKAMRLMSAWTSRGWLGVGLRAFTCERLGERRDREGLFEWFRIRLASALESSDPNVRTRASWGRPRCSHVRTNPARSHALWASRSKERVLWSRVSWWVRMSDDAASMSDQMRTIAEHEQGWRLLRWSVHHL